MNSRAHPRLHTQVLGLTATSLRPAATAAPHTVASAANAATAASSHERTRRTSVFDYRRYPAFTWPWSWRRSIIFGAFAGLYAIWQATADGVMLHDWRIGLEIAVYAVTLYALVVSVTPLTAAWVRERGWPIRREQLGVLAAVLLGVAVAHGVNRLGGQYVRAAVLPRMLAEQIIAANYLRRVYVLLNSPAGLIGETALFFLLSGGLALRSYFGEPQLEMERARERQMDELQLQKRQADLQLLVLQAQIEPHFLFNTLASLRSLLRTDVQRAEAMVDALVEHLRATVPIFRQSPAGSTLAEQLRICGSYLELMQVRLPDRLTYSISVPEALHSAAFPPLILLMLVENAVKHGIEPKPGPGHIRIEVRSERRPDGTHLLVSVTDDGAGLAAGLGHGVGLANIRAQLALKYGERAAFSLAGIPQGGTVACIDIPEEEKAAS